MKIRWTYNSIRFRIAPSELQDLQYGKTVTERLSVGGGGWIASIAIGSPTTELRGEANRITLHLSIEDRNRLAHPEAEGVYFHQEGETPISFYIEKDFPCAHPRVTEAKETETETFAPTPDFLARQEEEQKP